MGKLWEYWKGDIPSLDKEDWKDCLEQGPKLVIASRDKLIQVKFLHWVYYTPERLHRIFPEHDPVCPRCKTKWGTYLHMFWECPAILSYWEVVFAEINLRLQLTLTPTPSLVLLGIPEDEQRPHHLKLLISHLLYYAKKEILMKWLTPCKT